MALIFLLSMVGGINYLVNTKKISIFLAPSLMISAITCLMYIAGLLNIMPVMAYGILISGLVFLVISIRKVEWKMALDKIIPLSFIILICFWLSWYLDGALYADGDTMTHWGRIVRSMYQNNRLPNFTNSEIYCQSYPPATACWIYFVMKFTGYSEAIALYAQNIWIVFGAATLFNLRRDELTYNKKSFLIDIMIMIVVLMYLNSFDTLIVDVLLASTTISAFTIIADKGLKKEYKIWMLSIIISVLPIIKNSGILFSAYIVVVAIIFLKLEKNKRLIRLAILCLPSVTLFYLWGRHTKMVYYSASTTRHSIGIDYMKSVFLSRNSDDLKTIFQAFISKWFSMNISYEWEILGQITLLMIFLTILKNLDKKCIKIYVINMIGYIIYKLGLIAMYMFNMAGEDALRAAAYERYEWTYSLIMLFSVIFFSLRIIKISKNNILSSGISAITCVMLIFSFIYIIPMETFIRPDYNNGGIHRRLETLISNSNYDVVGKKVLVYSENKYAFFYAKFTFDNEETNATTDYLYVDSVLQNNSEGYEYIIIDGPNDQIMEVLGHHNIYYTTIVPLQ